MNKNNKFKKLFFLLAGLSILIFVYFTVIKKNNNSVLPSTSGNNLATQSEHLAYTAQFSRNAADVGVGDSGGIFSNSQRDLIAKNAGILEATQFHANWDLQAQFDDYNNNIIPAANAVGNAIKIFPYYNSTYWNSTHNVPNVRNEGWGSYASSFNTDWYLKDTDGKFITRKGDDARYVMDLSNPNYQAYAISTANDWILKNPSFAGVKFDSSDLLDGNYVDRRMNNNDKNGRTWNQILCGQSYISNTNCDKVNAWNDGLLYILGSVKKTFNAQGKEVYANGVSPSEIHGNDRNIGILKAVDGVQNEAFCYNVNDDGTKSNKPLLTAPGILPVGDINLMISLASQNKKIFEITSSRNNKEALKLAPYCLGGFLMGWQPGYSVWSYQTNYDDQFLNGFPEIAEQNLNLGNPTEQYIQKGNLLTRNFENGFVVENIDEKESLTTIAPQALYQYKDGKQIASIAKGESISIPPMTGYFFLNQSFEPILQN